MTKKSSPEPGARGLANFIALSVWEIAHRWHGFDPNTTDPKSLPLPVQDTLRTMCGDLLTQVFPAATSYGDDFGIASTAPKHDKWAAIANAAERTRGYQAMIDDFTRQHLQAVAGLERCANHREYDRQKLDSVYISIFGLRRFCDLNNLTMPEFWEPSSPGEAAPPPRLEQVDKAVEQAKASPEPRAEDLWTDIYYKGTEPPFMRGREREEVCWYSESTLSNVLIGSFRRFTFTKLTTGPG